MDMYAKWMKASYIKHKVYDLSSVSEARRVMCFSYSSQHNSLYLQLFFLVQPMRSLFSGVVGNREFNWLNKMNKGRTIRNHRRGGDNSQKIIPAKENCQQKKDSCKQFTLQKKFLQVN